jgi:hypothetical protein
MHPQRILAPSSMCLTLLPRLSLTGICRPAFEGDHLQPCDISGAQSHWRDGTTSTGAGFAINISRLMCRRNLEMNEQDNNNNAAQRINI